jgi:cytidylate kinase
MKTITIAIDGHSSTGKSTAAKQLAKALDFVYVDTGAMYRAVALFAIQNDLVKSDGIDRNRLIASLPGIEISFQVNLKTGNGDVYLNGRNVEKQIRTLEVSNQVSAVAKISEVRAKLVEQQQAMGHSGGVVMDGRDIGSVVFPDAELKVFMTASPEVRAQRRYDELKERGDSISYEEVFQNVTERDRIDSSRADSPLVQLPEARLLDTSNITRQEQFDLLLKWAREAMASAQ